MVLSKWAHWNVFYLGIRFVLPSLHFCPKHLSLGRITFDKGWFFEITQRIARGASLPSVPFLWCCPVLRVSRRSPRRPPLLEMEMCPCWGLGVRGVEWCHQRESFCRTQRQQTTWLSLTSEWEWGHRMSLSVNDCIKGREKASSCPQLKVSSCWEGVTFPALCAVAKGQSQQGRHVGANEVRAGIFLSLTLGAAYSRHMDTKLLNWKGDNTEFSTVCLYHSQSFFTSFLTEWELPKLQLPFSKCTNW